MARHVNWNLYVWIMRLQTCYQLGLIRWGFKCQIALANSIILRIPLTVNAHLNDVSLFCNHSHVNEYISLFILKSIYSLILLCFFNFLKSF